MEILILSLIVLVLSVIVAVLAATVPFLLWRTYRLEGRIEQLDEVVDAMAEKVTQ